MRNKGILTYALILATAFAVLLQPSASRASAFNDPGARTGGGTAGDLIAVEQDSDGGEITVGATAQIVTLFRNDSGRPITTGAIQLYPSSTVAANVSLNECKKEPLPAGAVCAVALSVKGMQQGNWRVEMLMRHSGRSRLVTTTLSGQVVAGEQAGDKFISDLEAIPEEVDFGTLSTSQPVVRGVVLRNITSEPIDINAIYIEAAEQAGYSLRTDCTRLEAGQACIVTIRWSPLLKGDATGVMLVEHTGPTSIASVDLDGQFDPDESEEAEPFPEAVPGKGLIVSSREEIDFGDDIDSTSAITVSLVNIGDAPVRLKEIALANTDNGLSISDKGCSGGTVLAPVEACPLTVKWSPVREGEILDDVQVVHDGARGVMVLPVRGEATGVINRDTKPLRLVDRQPVQRVQTNEKQDEDENDDIPRESQRDAASVLDGFVVTSHAPTRAIISGPGGSRIVFDGQEVVIGGVLWDVKIRSSGIEFASGSEKVLLLFDRSLSSFNRVSRQSGSGSGTSSGGGS